MTFVVLLYNEVFFTTGLTIVMFHGDPLLWRISEIIVRVAEAVLHNFCNNLANCCSLKITSQ